MLLRGLFQTAVTLPRNDLPQDLDKQILDDLVFDRDDWKKLKGTPARADVAGLNGLMGRIAGDPKVGFAFGFVKYLKKFEEAKIEGFDSQALKSLEGRAAAMRGIIDKLLPTIADGNFSLKDWNNLKAVRQEMVAKFDEGGIAALNLFLSVLIATNVQIEKGVGERLQRLAETGMVSGATVAVILTKGYETKPEPAPSTIADAKKKIAEARDSRIAARKEELYREAKGILEAVLLREPELLEGYDLLATVKSYLREDQELIDVLVALLGQHGDYVNGWINLGRACERIGKQEQARDAYTVALKREPENYRVHLSLGKLLIQLGDKEEALTHLEQFVSIGKKKGKRDPFFGADRAEARRLILDLMREIAAIPKPAPEPIGPTTPPASHEVSLEEVLRYGKEVLNPYFAGEVQRAYERHLKRNNQLAGVITIEVTVKKGPEGTTGQITTLRIVDNTTNDADLAKNIEGYLTQWIKTHPVPAAPPADDLTLTIPFSLTPTGR